MNSKAGGYTDVLSVVLFQIRLKQIKYDAFMHCWNHKHKSTKTEPTYLTQTDMFYYTDIFIIVYKNATLKYIMKVRNGWWGGFVHFQVK